jgi:orotidine-5'-phosphate decarboxylase
MKPTTDLNKVIVALDYTEPDKAFALVDELGDLIEWYKVGPLLFTQSGYEIIEFLHNRRKSIFLDLKLYDTPRVVRDTVKQFGELGIRMASVHCMGGHGMLEAAAQGCRGSQLRLLGITFLSTQSIGDSAGLGFPSTENELVGRLLDLALEHRLSGVLCSPAELAAVRPRMLPGTLLVSAGIRPERREVYQEDQKRVATPKEALEMGADYLVVGRPILQAREPRAAVERLFS